MTDDEKATSWAWPAAMLLLPVLIAAAAVASSGGRGGYSALEISALDACVDDIKLAVRTPSTVVITDTLITGELPELRVRGDFDAQNGFGALIGHVFDCEAVRTTADTWWIRDLEMEESAR